MIKVKGPIYQRTPAILIEFRLDSDSVLDYDLPEGWNALVYFLEGEAALEGDKTINCVKSTTVVFKPDETSKFRVTGGKGVGCKFILLGGKPLNEPIERYGPFVMNTEEEINQAFNDYKMERNGFEGARIWKSSIKNLAKKKK